MIECTFESGSRASLRHVVVHAIVERDGALLLVRRAPHLSEGDKWGLPGGFLDRDETLSGGVLRELREETGWDGRVSALMRINSRPDRPHEDRQNVAFDFVITPLEKISEPDKRVLSRRVGADRETPALAHPGLRPRRDRAAVPGLPRQARSGADRRVAPSAGGRYEHGDRLRAQRVGQRDGAPRLAVETHAGLLERGDLPARTCVRHAVEEPAQSAWGHQVVFVRVFPFEFEELSKVLQT